MPTRLLTLISTFFTLVAGVFLLFPHNTYAQSFKITGSTLTSEGKIMEGVVITTDHQQHTTSDSQGKFSLNNIKAGTHVLKASHLGFDALSQRVTVVQDVDGVTFVMQESTRELDEVVVQGKSEAQTIRDRPLKTDVISIKSVASQPTSMIELMNRTAGVRVRQTGGLGSGANLMLNGFQDRAIKYFRDGIPMDYLGAGYNFTLVPVNMLDRMEIYKGVLPAALGADALGGGLNMISKTSYARHAEASYEYGSFNTHRASANVFIQDTTHHVFGGGDLFYNHSDNDYNVIAAVTDRDLGTQTLQKVRLFHNTFTHYYTEVYGGVMNTRWADELRIGVTAFWMDRENQYGTRMSQPFGAFNSRQYSLIPTIRYKKSLMKGKITLDQFLVANKIRVEQVDTAHGTYDWYGNFLPSDSRRGEAIVRGSLSEVDYSYFVSRTNMAAQLAAHHELEVNVVYTRQSRKGNDPLGFRLPGSDRDALSVPAYYDKLVTAAGLNSRFLDDRLTNIIMLKYFHAKTDALDVDFYGNETTTLRTNERWGVAEAVKFSLNDHSFVRLSGELSTRLPEQDEIFGDGNLHVSNFELKPEQSTNINAGYRFDNLKGFSVEVNSFYRRTKDLILRVPYNVLFTRNENVDNVKGTGLEADVTVPLFRMFSVNGNFTYQDFRLFDTNNSATANARLKNTPFFFANLGATFTKDRVFSSRDRIQAYWYYTFVREYYLDYIPKALEPDGFLGLWGEAKFDARNIIPDQHLQTAGITYFPMYPKLSVGVVVKNVFDAEIYDNFRIQNAGRSFHCKVTYTIF